MRPPIPLGMRTVAEFGDRIGWGTGDQAARLRAEAITREEIEGLGVTVEIAEAWYNFYVNVAAEYPDNPSAGGRADLMRRILDLLEV